MLLLLFCLCRVVLCEEGDLGLSLNIGYAIDVFANYGDLSQVTQVISQDYDEGSEEAEPFREKNIRVFADAASAETQHAASDHTLSIMFCDTFEQLLDYYFSEFSIEGTLKPWKAFMGIWMQEEMTRALGIEQNVRDPCCYVLVKLSRKHRTVKMSPLTNVTVKDYVRRAIENMTNSQEDYRSFMKSYGTHYIDSYVTGNSVYQVFSYKRNGYNLLKENARKHPLTYSENLRFYFSSHFLKQIGDIRVASGNKTIEAWTRRNLKDMQYLYSRPTLLKLRYNPFLVHKLNRLLDDEALLGLSLRTLRPVFEDEEMADRFSEVVENDLQLWEINS